MLNIWYLSMQLSWESPENCENDHYFQQVNISKHDTEMGLFEGISNTCNP